MATPISSTATVGSPEEAAWNEFSNAGSLEQQFCILGTLLQNKETDYNRANPTETPKNRIVVQADYEAGQVNVTADLLLISDAVTKTINGSIVAHVPAS
ncbi:MAG: hypothetical protein QNJ51_17915 [Calothrix sp. MO_167.B12]|nr:hypothetical protein [Calothrix sp. MO_167.B12]